jgi:hypothetical protein
MAEQRAEETTAETNREELSSEQTGTEEMLRALDHTRNQLAFTSTLKANHQVKNHIQARTFPARAATKGK